MKRDVPQLYVKTYERAMTGRSRGSGVKAFCQECVGYVRKEVTLCTDTDCPLYPYRPYRSSAAMKKAKAEDEAEKAVVEVSQ